MLIKRWEKLPKWMKVPEVRPYWEYLYKKNFVLFFKRVFDIVFSILLLLLLSPLFLILSIAIKIDSRGPIFYKQVRCTQYRKEFKIHKFRSMFVNADIKGSQVTLKDDNRVTRVGRIIRKYRLDEISQLIDVLNGNMSFVGTRPEVPLYVKEYTNEMISTFLLPAGITSEASISFKDEAKMLEETNDPDRVYIEQILPKKMQWNLWSLKHFSFWRELGVLIRTIFAVLR